MSKGERVRPLRVRGVADGGNQGTREGTAAAARSRTSQMGSETNRSTQPA